VQASDSATFISDATGDGMTVTVDKNEGDQIDQARIDLNAVSKKTTFETHSHPRSGSQIVQVVMSHKFVSEIAVSTAVLQHL
jgi:hypothetical protein